MNDHSTIPFGYFVPPSVSRILSKVHAMQAVQALREQMTELELEELLKKARASARESGESTIEINQVFGSPKAGLQ